MPNQVFRVRAFLSMLILVLVAGGCAETSATIGGAGGNQSQRNNMSDARHGEISAQMLEAVNTLRQHAGLPALIQNETLARAALAHSKDMSRQRRPWHFSSGGSSPLERVARAGFQGSFAGELISETYETGLETIAVWVASPDTAGILLDPNATHAGVGWKQDRSGKLWWVLVTGRGTN